MSDIDAETRLNIRRMIEADLDRVTAIAASLPTAPHWTRAAYEAAIAQDAAARRIALMAELKANVVGFVVAGVVTPEAEIETIAVDGPAQGYGFGSALLDAMFEELKLAGVSEVALEVRHSNEPALAFYRRAGFGEVGRRRGYYRDPVEDAVLLRLGLT